jgi:hypothetical protein
MWTSVSKALPVELLLRRRLRWLRLRLRLLRRLCLLVIG